LKKFFLGFILGIILSVTATAYASDTFNSIVQFPVKYIFNGQEITLDDEYVTLNYNGHTYVPIRFMTENMGATVDYDEKTQTIKANYDTDAMQLVKTDSVSLAVPKTWTVDLRQGHVYFYLNGKEIGGLEIEGYYPPDTIYFPNHSELIEKKTLDGFFTTVVQATFQRSQPAASQDPTVTNETRFYFLIENQELAYDLYFHQENVDEQTMINIANSLMLMDSR